MRKLNENHESYQIFESLNLSTSCLRNQNDLFLISSINLLGCYLLETNCKIVKSKNKKYKHCGT